MKVIVGIPTFRRPKGLRALMDSLAQQRCDVPFQIVIADNEGKNGAGLAETRQIIATGYPHPVTLVAVPERGISQTRNALLSTAFEEMEADFLAMVDDDEIVDVNWLHKLLDMQRTTQADVVAGRVLPRFLGRQPAWAKGLSVYEGRERSAGVVEIADATNSVLFSAPLYRQHKPRFDLSYSLTGGGDKEFFIRLQALEARFAYAPEAVSWEIYGATRMTRKWAIKRSFRFGVDIRILMNHREGIRFWAVEASKIIVAIPLALIGMVVFGLLDQSRFMRSVLLLVRQIGKIAGLLGYRYESYRIVHGD